MAAGFTFEQIKLAENENLSNSVLNRALLRLWKNVEEVKSQSVLFPESSGSETTILANIYNDSDQIYTRQWYSISAFAKLIAKPKLVELTDVSTASPSSGQTLCFNATGGTSGVWQFKNLPSKITDLQNFKNVADTPNENDVLTYTASKGWVAQTVTKYIGVGYIYHQVCSGPTEITLPSTAGALSGGEQVVISKVLPNNRGEIDKFPILIKVGSGITSTIIGKQSIYTCNDNEEFSSIHLRACLGPDGNYMWVPVCATGSWIPSTITNVNSLITAGQSISRYTLTENQIKLQPYNIDISFSMNGADISKNYNIELKKGTDKIWAIDTANTTSGVNMENNSGLFSIQHNIMEGSKLVKTNVYYKDAEGNKLIQIVPDEIYFNATDNSYSRVFIDLESWFNPDFLGDTVNTMSFKVVVSI